MLWALLLFLAGYSYACSNLTGPSRDAPWLTFENIHFVNPHMVKLLGMGPTADYLDMTSPPGSPCLGSFITVNHMAVSGGPLCVKHSGFGRVVLYRTIGAPENRTIKVLYWPKRASFMGEMVQVAEGDILCAILSHHKECNMKSADFYRSFDADYGVWAANLLRHDPRVSIIIATVGRKTPRLAMPCKIIFSEDQTGYCEVVKKEPTCITSEMDESVFNGSVAFSSQLDTSASSFSSSSSSSSSTDRDVAGSPSSSVSLHAAKEDRLVLSGEETDPETEDDDEDLQWKPFEPVPSEPSPSPEILSFPLPSTPPLRVRPDLFEATPRIDLEMPAEGDKKDLPWAGRIRSAGRYFAEPPHKRPRKSIE